MAGPAAPLPSSADTDDLSAVYTRELEARQQAQAAANILKRRQLRQTEKPAAPGAPQVKGGEVGKPPASSQEMPLPKAEAGGGLLASAAAIGGDILQGVTLDLPRALASGARDAVQETLDLVETAATWLDENVGDLGMPTQHVELPDPSKVLGKTESTTGGIIKSVTQFLVGFKGAGKAMRMIQPASKAGKVVKAGAQGAVADFAAFDAQEGKLADLWGQMGLPENELTRFLASSPDDTEAEGRLKNALNGVLAGAAVEGVTMAAKALRSARTARQAPAPVDTPEAKPEIKDRDFLILGEPEGELIERRLPTPEGKAREKLKGLDFGVPDDVAAKGTAGSAADAKTAGPPQAPGGATGPSGKGQPHEPEFFVNWARVDAPEDVQNVMAQMADAFRPDVEQARRGKVTFEEIKLGAKERRAFDDLMARRKGEPMSAEAGLAARNLWASSARKLSEVAELAATNPTPANLFAFRKMVAVHQTIQNEVIAARTETARALAAWRIPAGADASRAQEIESVLSGMGGQDVALELASKIATAARAGDQEVVEKLVTKGALARTGEAVRELWINALLSGPPTHAANALSNTSVMFLQMFERKAAGKLASILGHQDSVVAGEATALWHGMLEGFKDGMRYAWHTARYGEEKLRLPGNKVDDMGVPAIGAEAFSLDGSGFFGRAADAVGNVVRTPSRMLTASDQFFKAVAYRAEVRAQALRQATREVQSGVVPESMFKHRAAQLAADPPEHIKLAAGDTAAYSTFTNAPGRLAAALMRMKRDAPILNVVIPFVRTPANIFNFTLERTPLAPLFKHWRADIAAGGARRDLAMARMSAGTMVMLTAADMVMTGTISGGGPMNQEKKDALRRTGWQPYSVKVGDRWYAYNRLDPIGLTLSLAADSVELTANTDWDRRDTKTTDEVIAAMLGAIANSTMSKSYMEGLSQLFEAVANPERGGMKQYLENLAGTLIPTGVAQVERVQDPYLREARTMLDAIRARTPGISDQLPARRDLWGRPISFESGMGVAWDFTSPVYTRKADAEPIDEEILKQGMNIQMPSRVQNFDGVPVDLDRHPGAYSRYLELAGNKLKHPAWGLGAKDFLNQVVTGKHALSAVYQLRTGGPDGGKESFVKDQLAKYRDRARKQLIAEFPTLRAELEEKRRQKTGLDIPLVVQ